MVGGEVVVKGAGRNWRCRRKGVRRGASKDGWKREVLL